MIIKIKKLHDSAVIPQYAKAGDAGMDLTATSRELVDHGSYGYVEYGTSLSLEIPEGYVGLIFPRSSISKTGLVLANAVGVIDSGYRGEVKCRFKWIRDTALYEVGERIAQLIILPYPTIELQEADALTETLRGENGFGSTGLN